jgi:hypothetical protein
MISLPTLLKWWAIVYILYWSVESITNNGFFCCDNWLCNWSELIRVSLPPSEYVFYFKISTPFCFYNFCILIGFSFAANLLATPKVPCFEGAPMTGIDFIYRFDPDILSFVTELDCFPVLPPLITSSPILKNGAFPF